MPNRVELLDFGRKAGLVDDKGEILCDWPVNPRYKEFIMPTTKKKPKKKKKQKDDENGSGKKKSGRRYY